MSDFVTLTCPSCGGKLQITNDIDLFACGHCGNEHVVKRSGGVVALSPVVEGLSKVQLGVDKTAAELAMARVTQEIRELSGQKELIALQTEQLLIKIAADKTQATTYGIRLVLYALVPIAFGQFFGWNLAYFFVALVLLGLALFAFFLVRSSSSLAQQHADQARSAFAAIDQEIASRNSELDNHRQIVSPKR